MTCTICHVRYALSSPQPDSTGALVFMCIECARPRKFPEATQPGLVRMESGQCSQFAYECAHCGERRCWTCDELSASNEIKTAVRWCPAHEQLGKLGQLPFEPRTDFANHIGEQQAANDNELHIALGRAEAAVSCLRVMVEQWGKEMRGGYSTPEMQWVLRKAKELIG